MTLQSNESHHDPSFTGDDGTTDTAVLKQAADHAAAVDHDDRLTDSLVATDDTASLGGLIADEEQAVVHPRLRRRAQQKFAAPNPVSLIAADAAIAFCTAATGAILTPKLGSLTSTGALGEAIGFQQLVLPFLCTTLLASHVMGLQDPRHCVPNLRLVRRSILTSIMSIVLTSGFFALTSFHLVGRTYTAILFVILLAGMLAVRFVFASLSNRYRVTHCLVGDDAFHFKAAQTLNDSQLHFGTNPPEYFNLDDGGSLVDFVGERHIDQVVLDCHSHRIRPTDMLTLSMQGIHVMSYPDFVCEQFGRVPTQSASAEWMVLKLDSSRPFYALAKRVFDIVGGLVGLIIGLPFMAIAALLIRTEGKGPIVYSQTRVGRFGQPFTIYKLRTMSVNAESEGIQWAKKNDNRVTKVGQFLRRTRMDELPQFFNILKGDMSVVGPRPERPGFVEELTGQIPFYNLRHMVAPGLTGWAQINLPYGASVEESEDKLQYDLFYVRRCSLLLDVHICLRTVVALFVGGR